jgi:hypothetical protein
MTLNVIPVATDLLTIFREIWIGPSAKPYGGRPHNLLSIGERIDAVGDKTIRPDYHMPITGRFDLC